MKATARSGPEAQLLPWLSRLGSPQWLPRDGCPPGPTALGPSPSARFLSLCSPSGLRTQPVLCSQLYAFALVLGCPYLHLFKAFPGFQF